MRQKMTKDHSKYKNYHFYQYLVSLKRTFSFVKILIQSGGLTQLIYAAFVHLHEHCASFKCYNTVSKLKQYPKPKDLISAGNSFILFYAW